MCCVKLHSYVNSSQLSCCVFDNLLFVVLQMLVLSNKSELDSMTDRLQELVKSEPTPPLHTISPGFVCAARSLDTLWYRARLKKPVQVNSLKVRYRYCMLFTIDTVKT